MKNVELNSQQNEAVCFGEGPLLVLAGAGSGKTKVLTHRVDELIKRGVQPSEIVLLTFTNKAAEEMKKRITKMDIKKVSLGFAGTFHTFGVHILREFGEKVGVPSNFSIFDSDDSERLMKMVIEESGLSVKENKPGMFLGVIGKMKNDLVTWQELEKTTNNYFLKQVAKIWAKYDERLRKNRALDFDDLLTKTVEVMGKEEVKEIINERYKWILVDEYQDTNRAQFFITKILSRKYGNITAVGDASQAIYSFRGADFRNLLLLQTEFPDLTTISLPKNYRSTQHILDSAYGVIHNNTSHPTIKLISTQDEGERVELFACEDEKHEARKIVTEAEKYAKLGMESAILYRTNAQSRSFEEELVRRDIGYKLVGGVRFYGRAEIKDLIAYLRLILNPEEEVAKKRVEQIGKRKYEKFENWRLKKGELAINANPAEVLKEIIEEVKYLDKFDENDESDIDRMENINELLAVASQSERIEKFLESTALAESEARKNSSEAKITLMTIHAAKGLEFEVVFLTGLEEGLFPHTRSIMSGSKDEIEEERRLMYVAMTRARARLFLSWSRSRTVYGGRKASIPSRFLSEIPEANVKKISTETWVEKKLNTDIDYGTQEKRRIVQDWEVEKETRDDFVDIDNW